MAALSTLALLAASGAKTYNQVREQRSAASIAEQQGDAQAGLLRTNASLATQQADDAIARGDQAASGVARTTRRLAGSQRAAFAAQGIDVDSGSAADVVDSDQQLGALDALTVKQNAAREAWGFKTQAAGYGAQADWTQAAGRSQATALRRQSLGTLLGGAAELANIYATAPKKVSGGPSRSVPAPAALTGTPFVPKPRGTKPVGWNG